MHPVSIQSMVGDTDIYLLDQIMKGRYAPHDILLDAGCGSGRNQPWFLQNDITVYGIDINKNLIQELQQNMPGLPAERFRVASLEGIPFPDDFFDHIICNAVLHFAENESQFNNMMAELVRVLKPGGSLFIRMASVIGMEDKVLPIRDGVFKIPDGTIRFLLTRSLLATSMQQNQLSFLEPLKIVNVNDTRCMATLVLQKALH